MRRLFAYILLIAAACAPTVIATKTLTPAPTPPPSALPAAPSPAPPVFVPLATPAPTPTPALAPRDAELVARLRSWCDRVRPGEPVDPPLDVLLALADGRSARELGDLVMARTGCPIRASSSGKGSDELLTLSSYTDAGVILWVDQGWWRAARLPLGYGYAVHTDRRIGGVRELMLDLDSGGSGGGIGVIVVQISGARLSVVLNARPGASHVGALTLDDDHILLTGRQLPDRPWGWTQNCCLPGGHDWLYERRANGFALVAERQTIGPGFALNAFIGAMAAGRPDLATDVGTASAIARAKLLITQPQYWAGDPGLLGSWDLDESRRWDALSSPLVLDRPQLTATVGHYGVTGLFDRKYVATLGYVDGGWRVTSFALPVLSGPD